MRPTTSLPSLRTAAVAVAGLAVLLVAAPASAADTDLADPSGVLRAKASGRWRPAKSEESIAATGFLGVKRAELFARVVEGPNAAESLAAWKTWRTEAGGEPTFTANETDALQLIAHSGAQGSVDYVRALAGGGKSAVVWVRLSGDPGAGQSDAEALLAQFEMGEPVAEERAGGEEEPAGEGGAEGDGPPKMTPDVTKLKDKDFRIELTLPKSFTSRKDIDLEGRRVLAASGEVGSDELAFLDVYAFDDFRRADAAGYWWQESERNGWRKAVRFEGDARDFRMFLADETWTRFVRIIETDGGVFGISLDANSQTEKAATALMERVLTDLKVLKKTAANTAPPGMQTIAGEGLSTQWEGPEDRAKRLHRELEIVDGSIGSMLELDPRPGTSGVLRVHKDETAFANAMRPLGVEDRENAYWDMRTGVVHTHPGVLSDPGARATLQEELARDAMLRRFGFRPPFWLERGVSLVMSTSAYENGRTDVPHPRWLVQARDAAGGSVEFEVVRWWTHQASADNPDRTAVAWSFAFLFLQGSPLSNKWGGGFKDYVQRLHETGSPADSHGAFDFARDSEMIEEWKSWIRKL